MKVRVRATNEYGENTVRFYIGSQSFTLCLHDRTKEEAKWFAKQLLTALKNLKLTGQQDTEDLKHWASIDQNIKYMRNLKKNDQQ